MSLLKSTVAILILVGIVAGQTTCPSEEFVEDRMEATEMVEQSVRMVFSRLLNDTTIANGSLTTMEAYEHIGAIVGATTSTNGFVFFQEAVNEIAAATFDACSAPGRPRPRPEEIPTLTSSFIALTDAGNVTQAREIYGKLLCLRDILSAEVGRRRRDDSFELLEEFFDSLDGTRLATIFAYIFLNPITLGFAVDDTGSMSAEISSVQRLIRSFITTERTEPIAYILTTFNDPDVGTPQIYSSTSVDELTELEREVNALRAHGGGDCPELGMTGILNALSLANPDSNVIVLTDASPKDVERKDEVIAKAVELRNSIHFFLSRDGCGDFSPYMDVAEATFGVVVNRIDEFEAFAEFADRVGRFFMGDDGDARKRDASSEHCFTFSSSLFTTSINILFTSVTHQINVTSPSGVKTMISTSGSVATYSNDEPEIGEYTMCSLGRFNHAISLTSTLDFFVEHFEKSFGIPVPGTPGIVTVTTSQLDNLLLTDPERPIVLKLVSEDDELLNATKLTLCGAILTGESINPDVSFYYQLQGYDKDGNKFSKRSSATTRIPKPDCPCNNGGSCISIVRFGRETILCRCPPGFTGSLCQHSFCSLTCLNGGTPNDDCSTCNCPVGFTGVSCEVDFDFCASRPCQNGALCQDLDDTFRCRCSGDFTGTTCETPLDNCYPDPCKNGGTCINGVDSFTCKCLPNFFGDTCENRNSTGCHLSEFCNDENITIHASSANDCCEQGGASFNDGTGCITACGLIEGDPHFSVPLLSKEVLCYSIQGYSGLAFNLICNNNYVINALFVDTEGDTSEATWIGKLAIFPQNNNKSDAVVFDSVNQEIVVVSDGNLKAAMIKQIIFNENGTAKFTHTAKKETGNPTIRVMYTKPQAKFDVTFYKNHLNVDWSMNYDELHNSHGLMGQFMKKGISIDTKKEMLLYSDGRDPVPVNRDSVMTGKWCWKAKNYGHQGEGLIEGDILDYMVPNILGAPDSLKKYIKE